MNIYAIERGVWEMYDGHGVAIRHVSGRSIIGLENNLPNVSSDMPVTYKAITTSLCYECGSQELKTLEGDNDFLKAELEYMSWSWREIMQSHYILTSSCAYLKIKYAIEWIDASKEIYRKGQTLISFICSRTNVSRSHAMEILKKLKQGGYIRLENGYLMELCRRLPEGY
jgi:hypothetical protein